MEDEGSPQRGPLKFTAFMAYIFIRASHHYWIALGNIASSPSSSAEMLENNEPSRRVPAFEVDTQVEMTGDVCDAAVPCSSSAPRLTAFSSNSTATSQVLHPGDGAEQGPRRGKTPLPLSLSRRICWQWNDSWKADFQRCRTVPPSKLRPASKQKRSLLPRISIRNVTPLLILSHSGKLL